MNISLNVSVCERPLNTPERLRKEKQIKTVDLSELNYKLESAAQQTKRLTASKVKERAAYALQRRESNQSALLEKGDRLIEKLKEAKVKKRKVKEEKKVKLEKWQKVQSEVVRDEPSVETIEKSLKDAGERRRAVVEEKVERVVKHLAKVDLARNAFKDSPSKAAIEQKLEAAERKRQQNIKKLMDKVTQHLEKVQMARKEQQGEGKELKKKLEEAEKRRRDSQAAIQAKIVEHLRKVQNIAERASSNNGQTQGQIKEKLQAAEKRRKENLKSIQDKIAEHLNKVASTVPPPSPVKDPREKLMAAEKRRLECLAAVKERLEAKEKYANQVRGRKVI